MLRTRHLTYLAAALAMLAGPASADTGIGVASTVKNNVVGSRAGQDRALGTGSPVFQNEAIITERESSAQLLFRDQTSLTVGQNSRVVLDRFVYNPRQNAGDVLLNVTKGSFRFVSGVARPSSYRLKVPKASIGIRGTVIEIYTDESLCQPGQGIETCQISCTVVVDGAIGFTPDATAGGDGQTAAAQAGDFICIFPDGTTLGPRDWNGPLLDLESGQSFIRNVISQWLTEGGDVLPNWRNDPLDSQEFPEQFPPPPPVEDEPPPLDDDRPPQVIEE